jgi:hypothetical protein
MKKLLAIVLFGSVLVISAKAQKDLKPFKVDVGVGYAIPGGEGAKAGVLFAVEPKYAVIPNFSAGIRFEAAVVARFNGYNENGDPVGGSVKGSGSYLLTGDYYFSNKYSFRPFIGGGAGIFSIASIEVDETSGEVSGGTKFGGLIRTGVEVSHFRFGIEYNLVPKTKFTGYDGDGNPTTGLTSKNGYIGIKIGVCFGGGPK